MPKTRKQNEETGIEIVVGEAVERHAPEQRIVDIKEILQPQLNAAQLRILTNKTPDWAIKTRQGRGGKAFKYVPHGYVTDTLNKAFGFDWDLIFDPMGDGKMYALELEPIFDSKNPTAILKHDRHVAVCGRLIVRVHQKAGRVTEITKSGFGSQIWLSTMEFGDALKAARSDLIKTCAFQLGIALDLYWNERAELDDHVKKEFAKSEGARIADQLTGVPETPVVLLTRSMADFKFDGLKVAEICNTTIDLLMALNPEEIAKCWKLVQNAATAK